MKLKLLVIGTLVVSFYASAERFSLDKVKGAFAFVKSELAQAEQFVKNKRDTKEAGGVLEATTGQSIDLDYGAWQVNYSCEHRGPNYVYYKAVADTGSYDRYKPFHLDNSLPESCPSQKSTNTYRNGEKTRYKYDRGHLITQNHLDFDKALMKKANYMTNIVPQEEYQNRRGLWRGLEKRTECTRDEVGVHVWAGVIWGEHSDKDAFKNTHGVTVPEYLFRIHKYDGDENYYAWLMANTAFAKPKSEDNYRVSAQHILKNVAISNLDSSKIISSVNKKDPYRGITCSYK